MEPMLNMTLNMMNKPLLMEVGKKCSVEIGLVVNDG